MVTKAKDIHDKRLICRDRHCSTDTKSDSPSKLHFILRRFSFICLRFSPQTTCLKEKEKKKAVSPLALISLNIKLLESYFDSEAM